LPLWSLWITLAFAFCVSCSCFVDYRLVAKMNCWNLTNTETNKYVNHLYMSRIWRCCVFTILEWQLIFSCFTLVFSGIRCAPSESRSYYLLVTFSC
jgi:hypothetical protein